MPRKTLLVKRTLKMSSDQGEAPLGPCCQVPGFPGCQGESPAGFLVAWTLGSLEKRKNMTSWRWGRRRTNQFKLNDQGEAPLGPGYQVPGFPGCQGESPAGFLVVRALGSLEKTMRSQKGGDGHQEAQIKSS